MSEEKEYKDWYLDLINENKNNQNFIDYKINDLDSKFQVLLEENYKHLSIVKQYICLRYGFIFENITCFEFLKIHEIQINYLTFAINFLRVLFDYKNNLPGDFLAEAKLLMISFIHFLSHYSLYDIKNNENRKEWYDDYFFLIPKDINLVIESTDNLDIKELLTSQISKFYKCTNLEEKEAIIWIIGKKFIDLDIGLNYKKDFFNKNNLNNIWRKKIHAIRHGKNSEKKNENNPWWIKYNREFNEEQKNKFLEDLLFFLVVFWIDKIRN